MIIYLSVTTVGKIRLRLGKETYLIEVWERWWLWLEEIRADWW